MKPVVNRSDVVGMSKKNVYMIFEALSDRIATTTKIRMEHHVILADFQNFWFHDTKIRKSRLSDPSDPIEITTLEIFFLKTRSVVL